MRTTGDVFKFLYYLKDEVNKSLNQRSIQLSELRERFAFSGGVVNDVLVADTLVIMAIHASANGNETLFVDFTQLLHVLLPLPHDSELGAVLSKFKTPIVYSAYTACRNTRLEHGHPIPRLDWFHKTVRETS